MKVLHWEVKCCMRCPMAIEGELKLKCYYPVEDEPIKLDIDEYVSEFGRHRGEIHPDCPASDKEER